MPECLILDKFWQFWSFASKYLLMKNYLIIILSLMNSTILFGQLNVKQEIESLSNASEYLIKGKQQLKEEITLKDKEGITILGSDQAELLSFNNIPHILKIENCKNIKLDNIRLRYGVKNVGEAIIIISNSENIEITNCNLGQFGKYAITIDKNSKSISINNSQIHDCQHSGIKSLSANVEILNNSFKSNSELGKHRPDLEIETENSYPLVRYNNFTVSEYPKHKTTADQLVENKNSISYNFDCFKIVKKYETDKGEEGKVIAFFEGENNKILDKIELQYKGPKGTITASAYFLNDNIVYTSYEVKKGKIGINYMVYGDFLDHLEQADSKSAAHVAGDEDANKKEFDNWLKAIDSWKAYLFAEAEEFELYENKSEFITLPY
jgi:hypothetical protein